MFKNLFHVLVLMVIMLNWSTGPPSARAGGTSHLVAILPSEPLEVQDSTSNVMHGMVSDMTVDPTDPAEGRVPTGHKISATTHNIRAPVFRTGKHYIPPTDKGAIRQSGSSRRMLTEG